MLPSVQAVEHQRWHQEADDRGEKAPRHEGHGRWLRIRRFTFDPSLYLHRSGGACVHWAHVCDAPTQSRLLRLWLDANAKSLTEMQRGLVRGLWRYWGPAVHAKKNYCWCSPGYGLQPRRPDHMVCGRMQWWSFEAALNQRFDCNVLDCVRS